MGSTPPPKQYPVKKHQGTLSPGWGTLLFQGSECEYLYDYNEGGLCPVHINDVLQGSDVIHEGNPRAFKIVGKLGRGSYSTVWLGRDTISDEYLAIKVLRQEHSTSDNPEMRILRKLGKLRAAFFHTHVPTQNRFLCLVLQPLGSTLRERINAEANAPNDIFSLTIFLRTLLTKVLDFHQQGICHGDISTGNVAFGIHPDAFTEEALNKTFEQDELSTVKLKNAPETSPQPSRPANLPEYIVVHPESPLKTNTQDMSLVDIIDFGKGFETPSKSNVFGTPNYAAPEVDRNGQNIATAKSDLWSLGCVFAFTPTDSHLFYRPADKAWYLDSEHDTEKQISYIEGELKFGFLEYEPEYCRILARLIHALVRADPQARNPQAAKDSLNQLEALVAAKQ